MIPGSILLWLGRHWPTLACAAAVIGAAWYLDHRGYRRATADAAAAQAEERLRGEREARRIEKALSAAVGAIDGRLAERIGEIEQVRTTIVQPIRTEIADDPRYRSADCALSDGLFGRINAARAASHSEPDGGVTVPLPEGPAAP